MKKSLTAVGITWLVGIIWKFYLGDYVNEPGIFYQITFVIAGGAALIIWVIPIPLIVALVQKFRTKKFPHQFFANLTYVLLIIFAIMMFVGASNLKSQGVI